MIATEENPYAFPVGKENNCQPEGGMTMLQWFAGQALAGGLNARDAMKEAVQMLKECQMIDDAFNGEGRQG